MHRIDRTRRVLRPRTQATMLALALAAGALSGCATASKGGTPADVAGLGSGYGHAVRANTQAQFVAPSPEQKADTYIRPNAARQRLAVETYEAGEVEIASSTTD